MPEGTSRPICLVPVIMPVPVSPPLGDWHHRGFCAGEDPDVFFPSHGNPGTKAREICANCVVRRDCLEYATEADEFGIWGGLDQQERRSLRRKRRRRATASDVADDTAAVNGEAV
jgi:WhiB family transcriptional regulator, redox-sensing transcriptional regulator